MISICRSQQEQIIKLEMDKHVHVQHVRVVRVPHGILEELGQDVIQRQRDEGEASCYVPVDPHSGRVPVLVLTQTPEEHMRSIYSNVQDLIY